MSDANILRGQSTFQAILTAELDKMDKESSSRLKELQEHFWDKVGIMPLSGLYAAKRLGNVCLQASIVPTENLLESISLVDKLYQDTNAQSAPTFRLNNDDTIKNRGTLVDGFVDSGDLEHDTATKELATQIDDSIDRRAKEVFVIEDEDGEVREFEAEVIDMLEDAAAEGELSIEGMRAMGIVGLDFDTTKDTVSGIVLSAADELVTKEENNWYVDADGFLIILCPMCRCEKIYPMGENMFGCFECDAEFLFRHNLCDVT